MKQYQIDRIKNLMDAKGITNQDLASKCGVSAMTISRLLTHTDHNPTTDTIEKIAEALGVHEQYIFESETEAENKSKLPIRGFIEYGGIVSSIKTFKQLEKVYEGIRYDMNVPKLVKELRAKDKENEKTQEKTKLDIAAIDLRRFEEYDTSKVKTWSFLHTDDVRNGNSINIGNFSTDHQLDICGEHFFHSESAYIVGLFSQNTEESIKIQRELQYEKSPMDAKYRVRAKYVIAEKSRKDWDDFKHQWMLYVVWQKCLTNDKFAELLRLTPKDVIIIENTTNQTNGRKEDDSSEYWGAKNRELQNGHDLIEREVELSNPSMAARELKQLKSIERNKLNNIGIWRGINCLGKVLNICKYCLDNNTTPPIDYSLLSSKQIYLFGKLLTFDKELSHYPKKKEKKEKKVTQSSESPTPITKNYKTIIFDFDGTLLDTELLKKYTYLFKGLKRNSPEHKKGRKEYLSHVKDCPMFEGMDAVIDFIRKNHVKVAVVTANTKDRVVEAIKVHKWSDIISEKNIYGCYSLGKKMTTKDDGNPALFELALKEMGISASECIALGNKPHDKVAANSVGIKAYHCLWGASDENKAVMLKDNDSLEYPIDIIKVMELTK